MDTTIIYKKCLFVRIRLRYEIHFMMMWRGTLISSDFYEGLMGEISEVGVLVGPCDMMLSRRDKVL